MQYKEAEIQVNSQNLLDALHVSKGIPFDSSLRPFKPG